MAAQPSGIIDPRLQYAQHQAPPSYAQQPSDAPSRGQQRRSKPPSQSQSQPAHESPHPRQPYFLTNSDIPQPPAQPEDSYDPALDYESSPANDSSVLPSPLNAGTGDASGSVNKTADLKRSRACDSCRGLKVRCDFGDNLPGEPCKRCAKARRPCVVTPATRRRQKKADSRVADLERKVDALTARLAEKDDGRLLENLARDLKAARKRSASPTGDRGLDKRREGSPEKRRRLDDRGRSPREAFRDDLDTFSVDAPANPGFVSLYNQTKATIFDHSDVERAVSRLVDKATSQRLFRRYTTHFMPRYPAVAFPPGTTADSVRKSKPILFLAILSSTSYGANIPVETQIALEEALRDALADSLWKKGEKSLELIQALQVATLWHRPPANFEQHMFYQMVHVSAFMAIDIGIGKRMLPERRKLLAERWRRDGLMNPESAEVRRAWLTSYFLCTNIAMLLRRPVLFKFTDYTRECLDYLETAEDALESDKVLCQHIRLAHICEDTAVQFAFDDPTVNLSISDSKVTYTIRLFEKELAEVCAKEVADCGVKLSEHVTNLYLHEIALHSQNNAADFKAAFMEDTFRPATGQIVLGPQHVDALTACHSACSKVLDTFASYDIDILFTMPMLFCVRCMYTLVVLVKLYMAASGPGEIGTIIKPEDLHVDENIERLRQIFQAFMDKDAQAPHSKFLFVMERLQERFQDIKRGDVNVAEVARAAKLAAATASAAVRGPQNSDAKQEQSRAAEQSALGLHALSEAAMIGDQQQQQDPGGNSGDTSMSGQQGQGQPTSQGWYQDAGQLAGLVMDPQGYPYAQQVPVLGFGDFDYGLGGLGMGMDGAISGLFMADGLWNYNEPQVGMYRGWAS